MKKFGIWLAGIVGTILAGVGVYYLTLPKPPVVFEGMIYSGDSPVAKAMVELELKAGGPGGGTYHDSTDENGAYRLEFTGLKNPEAVTYIVSAPGYQASGPKTFPSAFGTDNRMDIELTQLVASAGANPVPAPGAGAAAPGAPAANPGGAAAPAAPGGLAANPGAPAMHLPPGALIRRPLFVPKMAARATVIKVK